MWQSRYLKRNTQEITLSSFWKQTFDWFDGKIIIHAEKRFRAIYNVKNSIEKINKVTLASSKEIVLNMKKPEDSGIGNSTLGINRKCGL